MPTTQRELRAHLENLLNVKAYSDYCPNGLQVEGRETISKVAFAVSASAHSVAAAQAQGACALIVHHGLFWNFHVGRTLTGPFKKRIFPLIKNDINLFAYHLPLDAHLELGNAAVLARAIGLEHITPFGEYKKMAIGVKGDLPHAQPGEKLQKSLEKILEHRVLHACPEEAPTIKSMGIITGGANSQWTEALQSGLDAYLTGEMSEHDWHESREAGLHMFAGGHNATETFGIQALMAHLEVRFSLECFFIPSENPA